MSVLENSFRKTKGVVLQTGYSFTSYEKAINKLSNVFINTGKLSLIAIMIIVILGIVIAYVTVRRSNPLNYMIDIMSMIPYVIPGSIIGIGLVIAFNNKPLILTGTAVIMIIDYVIRELPYTVRSSSAILNNIDISIEEAALSLGSGNLETFFTVTLPIMSPGVISGAIYSWISIITELSGSIMLYTVGTKTLTIEIYSQVVRGNNGVAAALATILSAITALATMIIFKLTGKDEIAI
jgi:iron(III) transport system permease protein